MSGTAGCGLINYFSVRGAELLGNSAPQFYGNGLERAIRLAFIGMSR